jgi:hypothetical protein
VATPHGKFVIPATKGEMTINIYPSTHDPLYRRLSLHGVVNCFLNWFSSMYGISKALDLAFDLSPHAYPNDQRIFLFFFFLGVSLEILS